jgi:hypothetical protein
MKSRNLVVARSGEKSLHMNWLKGVEPNFDLIVTFYGNEVPQSWSETEKFYEIIPIKGSKWKGLHQYLTSTESWKEYDYILLPDDDLLCSAHELNAVFNTARLMNADLCQPALDRNSYFSHTITLKHSAFNFRYTNFVELMIPCLSRRMLEATLELFTLTESGWGMDNYWWEIIQKNEFLIPVIIDDITVTHTRPVGSANNGTSGGGLSPLKELKIFCEKLSFSPMPLTNIGGKPRHHDKCLFAKDKNIDFEMLLIKDIILMSGQVNTVTQVNYIMQQQNLFQKMRKIA